MMHVPLGDTYEVLFTTRRFSSGAPFTLAGTPVLSVYEEANLTQITAGVSVSADYDSVTGLNQATVVATGANGYEVGKYYSIVITTGTVDSVSVVGEVVGHFRVMPAEDAGAGIPDVNMTHVADSAVSTTTAQLGVNVVQVSGDATAADNLELQYDGTGLTGSNYPATQAQVGNIAVAGAAINTVADSYTLTTGTQSSGTFASTQALDGTAHQHTDAAGALDLYYEFDVGNDGVPTSAKASEALTGNNDSVGVYAYNWAGTSWDQIGTLTGTSGATYQTNTYDLLTAHVGTGSNVGLVRIRYYAASGLTSATLYVDQILVSYAQATAGIANGSSITLSSSAANTNLIGRSWSLALGGQDITGSYIYQATSVTGTGTGTNGSPYIFQECLFGSATLDAYGFLENTAIGGTITFASTGGASTDSMALLNCYSAVAGGGTPTIDASGVTKATAIQARHWNGGGTWTFNASCTVSIEVNDGGTHTITTGGGNVEFRGAPGSLSVTTSGSGTTNIVIGNGAPITIAGTGGTVNVYGMHGGITDSSSGTTVTDYGADVMDIGEILTDTGTTIPASIATVDTNVDDLKSGIIYGSAATGTLSTTQASTNLTGYADDQLIGRVLIWLTGNCDGEATRITDYAATGGTLTFDELTTAPSNGDLFKIV